jgi:LPXTG-site transpeptidase (sortase) family protein
VTEKGASAGTPRGTTVLPLHLLGNLLLGAAIGLLVYVGVTDLVGAADQADLASAFGSVPPAAAQATRSDADAFDFSGWDAMDAAYWRALPDGGAFGRLVAPAMGLDVVAVRGTSPADLRKGPGWIDTTDLPGPSGNVGISGHRTTYAHPFGNIQSLAAGDTIDLYSPYRRYRYEVVETLVVTPDKVEVVAHTEEPMLTLTACHPPLSAALRYVVRARLVEAKRLDAIAGGE